MSGSHAPRFEKREETGVEVKVLGTGCASCRRLEAVVREAAEEAGLGLELEKVTDVADIMAYGVMSTPGLVVAGALRSSGRVPGKTEILAWLRD
jgi:small redox-active disulfide protein 2